MPTKSGGQKVKIREPFRVQWRRNPDHEWQWRWPEEVVFTKEQAVAIARIENEEWLEYRAVPSEPEP